jgi:hypothetical protein
MCNGSNASITAEAAAECMSNRIRITPKAGLNN